MLTGRVVRVMGAIAGFATFVSGCDSHATVGGSSAGPSYSADVRLIAICPAGVRAPAALLVVDPAAKNGPTAVLRVRDAVAVAAGSSDRIGFTGLTQTGEDAVVCRIPMRVGDRVVLIARALGYVRVGVVPPQATAPAVVFVKVTS